MDDFIRAIELILIYEGQHDLKFKLGETIKYAPYEITDILKKHADELKQDLLCNFQIPEKCKYCGYYYNFMCRAEQCINDSNLKDTLN